MCQFCDDPTLLDNQPEPSIDLNTLFVSFSDPKNNASFEESASAWFGPDDPDDPVAYGLAQPDPEADPDDCDCELCALEDEVEELEGVLDVATDTIEHYAEIINIQYEALVYIAANPESGVHIADFLTEIVVPPR